MNHRPADRHDRLNPGNWRPAQAAAAALALGTPLALGALAGHLNFGRLAALGALAACSGFGGLSRREIISGLGYTLLSANAAMLTGACLAGHGHAAAVALPLLAGAAGLVGGLSRPMAHTVPHFILYTIIAASMDIADSSPMVSMLPFVTGSACYAGLELGLALCFHRLGWQNHEGCIQAPNYPFKLLMRRWAMSLKSLSGWHYALRLTLCLAAAQSFERFWPHHHGYWASVTVVIVMRRDIRAMLPRILERSAGTLGGVMLAGLLLTSMLPAWFKIGATGILAAGRIMLKDANYILYAVVMTVLVVLLLDFDAARPSMIIIDRLAATTAGCLVAMVLGYLPWYRLPPGRINKMAKRS